MSGRYTLPHVKITFQGRDRDRGDNLIFYLRTQRLIDRGCEEFLASFIATPEHSGPIVRDTPVVKEFASGNP